mgnify:CR=1 FL=1
MLVDTPKALDSWHCVNSFDVGLVIVDRRVVHRLVNPECPGCLKWYPLALLKIETINWRLTHFSGRKWHNCRVLLAYMLGYSHRPSFWRLTRGRRIAFHLEAKDGGCWRGDDSTNSHDNKFFLGLDQHSRHRQGTAPSTCSDWDLREWHVGKKGRVGLLRRWSTSVSSIGRELSNGGGCGAAVPPPPSPVPRETRNVTM